MKLAAAPSDGAANEALLRLIARTLSVRVGDVTLVNGASSRLKRLRITGDATALAARLVALCKETQ